MVNADTVCPRSPYPYIEIHYIRIDETSWTYRIVLLHYHFSVRLRETAKKVPTVVVRLLRGKGEGVKTRPLRKKNLIFVT